MIRAGSHMRRDAEQHQGFVADGVEAIEAADRNHDAFIGTEVAFLAARSIETSAPAHHQMEMIFVAVIVQTVFAARRIDLEIDIHVVRLGHGLIAAAIREN